MPAYLPASGEIIGKDALRAPHAQKLAGFIESKPPYSKLVEIRAFKDWDVLVLDVEVQRPQLTVHEINTVERIAIYFNAAEDALPVVHALRENFPFVPHLNQTPDDKPRSLCLYDEPWSMVRLSWTAGRFVTRIRTWLADTALGKLHREDQVLEPLIAPTNSTLVLPAKTDFSALSDSARVHKLQRAGEHTFVAFPLDTVPKEEASAHLLFAITTRITCHGIIRRTPHDLWDLHEMLADFGVNLAETLGKQFLTWKTDQENNPILQRMPIILLALPKSREEGGKTEAVEYHAFFCNRRIEEIGIALNLFSKEGSKFAGILINQPISAGELAGLEILPMQVLTGLTREGAARQNGVSVFDEPIAAIGFGALGSQIINNLIRSGFGRWTVIDSDTFAPHNGARHWELPRYGTGQYKTDLAGSMGDGCEWESIVGKINEDVMNLSTAELNKHSLIADFSASVPVSRFLAHCPELAVRCASVFITPGGGGLAVAVEDRKRKVRLDWLEMLHYRQVLLNKVGQGSMVSTQRNRYGNSCRDRSTVLSQDDVALWASTASRAMQHRVAATDSALLMIWKRDVTTGSVAFDSVKPSRCHRFPMHDWTLVLDDWLRKKLVAFRASKLPNETGGILIGHFDVLNMICYLVDALPSPKDSEEWPDAYYRGCEGLRSAVLDIEGQTLGQLSYVGEWHSHPQGCSVLPSSDDLTAYGWLAGHMNADSYPGIMLIIGDKGEVGVVTTEPKPF